MWNRTESEKIQPSNTMNAGPKIVPAAPTALPAVPTALTAVPAVAHPSRPSVALGSSLVIKGELTGSEDLLIEGRLEGKIVLPEHRVTIGPHARISAEVVAKTVIIEGLLTGNVTASERFEIRAGGHMTGDLVSPKVVMAEGSDFRGSVDMRSVGGSVDDRRNARSEPVAV